MVKAAGAREVHLRISCPPTISPCFYGVDTPSRAELIAATHTIEEIRKYVGADSCYLSLEGLRAAVGTGQQSYCTSCYTGVYPVAFPARRARVPAARAQGRRLTSCAACVVLLAVLAVGPSPRQRASQSPSPAPRCVAGRTTSARHRSRQSSSRAPSIGSAPSTITVRTAAARTIRRAPAATAVPALLDAAAQHADGYVRFRALVLLSGFNDPRTHDVMAAGAGRAKRSPSHRGYSWFEHNPDPQLLPRLLDALEREESEFVRPALTRTLAAYGERQPRSRDALIGLVLKGQDFFRSVVIEALGDYKAAYALTSLTAVAKLDGPLQDDAVLALGKIGDKRSLETLAALQRTAPRSVQPSIAAAICLLGINCSSHQGYLEQSLRVRDRQRRLPGAASRVGVGLGRAGDCRRRRAASCV